MIVIPEFLLNGPFAIILGVLIGWGICALFIILREWYLHGIRNNR